jgi:hypothetical protein
LFLKYFNYKSAGSRNKKLVSSAVTSGKPNSKQVKIQYFKVRSIKRHKFLSKSNSIYSLCHYNTLICTSVLLSFIKVSYKNSFLGFFTTHDGCIYLKKLSYGFSHFDSVNNNMYLYIHYFFEFDIKKKFWNIDTYTFMWFVDFGYKFYNLHILNKVYKIANSAGTYCRVMNRNLNNSMAYVRIPSGKHIWVSFFSSAFLGRVSNIFNKFIRFSSFISKFNLKKKRQTVRGIAKNPVDHPNGGRSKIKQPFKNPWGFIAKKNK